MVGQRRSFAEEVSKEIKIILFDQTHQLQQLQAVFGHEQILKVSIFLAHFVYRPGLVGQLVILKSICC
jgi:hypothetical protein